MFRIYNTAQRGNPDFHGVTLGGAGFTFEYPRPQFPIPIPANSKTMAQALNVWVSLTPTSAALSFKFAPHRYLNSGTQFHCSYGSEFPRQRLTSGVSLAAPSSVPRSIGAT